VELTARFDEASNIRWSKSMEDAGIQVFHGLVGLKTHCKLALLVRRDLDGVMRHYVHIGTGNYNQTTSRFYTDLSFMTSNTKITAAVHAFFNYLTAYAERKNYEPLAVAPINLAETVVSQIRRETDHAAQGKPARIIAKMNALLEPNVVKELYAASQAGVQIDLIVRGMCALRPGIPGVSENIRVRSIVGRLLEHSRIFYFLNNGADDVYISSADWMPRNFYERAEVCCPVNDPRLKKRLLQEILPAYLADNVKARVLSRDGSYSHIRHARAKVFNAQEFLIDMAENKAGIEDIPEIPEPISKKRPRRRKAPSVMAAKGEQ
jgi:polyphosphate kinase